MELLQWKQSLSMSWGVIEEMQLEYRYEEVADFC